MTHKGKQAYCGWDGRELLISHHRSESSSMIRFPCAYTNKRSGKEVDHWLSDGGNKWVCVCVCGKGVPPKNSVALVWQTRVDGCEILRNPGMLPLYIPSGRTESISHHLRNPVREPNEKTQTPPDSFFGERVQPQTRHTHMAVGQK